MKIAISGTHGTYKTSIVNAVYDKLLLKNEPVYKIDETHRVTSKIIANDTKIFCQEENMTLFTYYSQLAEEAKIKALSKYHDKDYHIIADRTPFDTFIYNKNNINELIDISYIKCYTSAIEYVNSQYDMIYLIVADKNICIDDNDIFRDKNKKEQMRINTKFLTIFEQNFTKLIKINQQDIYGDLFFNFVNNLASLF